MKKTIKNNYKFLIGVMVGLVISVISVYAVEAYIESNKVLYDNKYSDKNNLQEAIDELYERSGIHKEKWVEEELHGADPVLKDSLIPVEIKPNGDVYYANLNSEWYNYEEKRWANAVILTDSAPEYSVGQHIAEKDIESFFVWIPRFQYKIWNTGEYEGISNGSTLKNENYNNSTTQALNRSMLIDIKFGDANTIVKMDESDAILNNYYTHPAFTLGNKNLNGIWVGKFETGGTSAGDMVVKPDVNSWRNANIKTFFDVAKEYNNTLDSHMMKNTEWGAAAYLSHSEYGIGAEVRINNNNKFKTGYAAAANTDQSSRSGISGDTAAVTKLWNTPTGHLASTTGNITGVYDMSGGAWEYVAACIENTPGGSDFDGTTLAREMTDGYIDKYNTAEETSYNKRILGDATGELGPFYQYYDKDGTNRYHNSWYGDWAYFVNSKNPWFYRGGGAGAGGVASQFYFSRSTGAATNDLSFRLVLSPINN